MTPIEAVSKIVQNDTYHAAIVRAAKSLLRYQSMCWSCGYNCPNYDRFTYRTQYMSGATVWGDEDMSVMVSSDGEIDVEVA